MVQWYAYILYIYRERERDLVVAEILPFAVVATILTRLLVPAHSLLICNIFLYIMVHHFCCYVRAAPAPSTQRQHCLLLQLCALCETRQGCISHPSCQGPEIFFPDLTSHLGSAAKTFLVRRYAKELQLH